VLPTVAVQQANAVDSLVTISSNSHASLKVRDNTTGVVQVNGTKTINDGAWHHNVGGRNAQAWLSTSTDN
jgi:hypothetical protein